MHEAAPVRSALAAVVDGWPRGRRSGHLELEVADPSRADAEVVDFYARVLLADRGLDAVTVTVVAHARTCSACGASVMPSPTDPWCAVCGLPLPPTTGPAVTCRECAPEVVGPCA